MTKRELIDELDQLDTAGKRKVMILIDLMANCPGFMADYKAAIPPGEDSPPLDVVEQLMDKWRAAV